ncbi:MAG TPA: hypothetical protein VFX98_01835 [Longimicrobiaceae bacterium]|nr:hypothetical protein [Longimicrobiaceae bacterium]
MTGPERTARRISKTAVVALVAITCGVGVVLGLARLGSDDSSATPGRGAERFAYQTVEWWTIPAGGFGNVIVVDSSLRSEPKLRALGEQLRRENEGYRYVFIEVFSNLRAAALRDSALAERVSAEEAALYARHFIASYVRNSHTGHHQLRIAPNGIGTENGWETITYPPR